jgi:hypothetical protein
MVAAPAYGTGGATSQVSGSNMGGRRVESTHAAVASDATTNTPVLVRSRDIAPRYFFSAAMSSM